VWSCHTPLERPKLDPVFASWRSVSGKQDCEWVQFREEGAPIVEIRRCRLGSCRGAAMACLTMKIGDVNLLYYLYICTFVFLI